MCHDIDGGFIGWCGLMHRLFLRYQTSTMHNLSHQRITLPSWQIKEVIRAARHAAEMTDNALQQPLNRVAESCLHIILKGSAIIYQPINTSRSLPVSDLAGLVTMEIFFLFLIEQSLVIQKPLVWCVCVCVCLCVCVFVENKQEQLFMSFPPQGTLETVLSCLLWLTTLCPNNKYAGMMIHCPTRVHTHTQTHTHTHKAHLVCLVANVLSQCRSDKYVKMTVFVFFSFGICYDSLHK